MTKRKTKVEENEPESLCWCAWCGEYGTDEYMYKNRGDWYHANCVIGSSESDKEFLFGEIKQ
uniref:ORF30 n=1 Tax=Nitrosopumilaceae spindle-shaped virus TaxID=3065433 RepID=A0AAT9J783_9VIRU